MKKFWLKTATALLILLMAVGSLASCSTVARLNKLEENERADMLFETVNKRMGKVKSYETEIEMTLSSMIGSQKLKAEMSGTIITRDGRGNQYLEISETEMEMHLGGKLQLSQETVEGYQDGKMFYAAKVEQSDKKSEVSLYSELDKEAYITHQNEKTDSFDLDFDPTLASKSKACKMNDNKTWVATYSEFDKDGMAYFRKLFKDYGTVFGEDVSIADAIMTLKTDKKFYPTLIELSLVFEGGKNTDADDLPTCTMTLTFSDINAVDDDKVDLSDYTKVDDLRALDMALKALDDYSESESGRFELEIDQKVTRGSREETYHERDVCSFANEDESYSYNVTATTDSYGAVITYANGVQNTTVKQNGKSSTNKANQSEAQAKSFIQGLLNPATLSKTNVIGIKDEGDGVYVFKLADADLSAFSSLFNPEKAEKSITVTVTLKDGKIESYAYELNVSADLSTNKITIQATATCEYSYVED